MHLNPEKVNGDVKQNFEQFLGDCYLDCSIYECFSLGSIIQFLYDTKKYENFDLGKIKISKKEVKEELMKYLNSIPPMEEYCYLKTLLNNNGMEKVINSAVREKHINNHCYTLIKHSNFVID